MVCKEPFTINELEKWNINKNINPRTQRKIKKNKKLYKNIEFQYKNYILSKVKYETFEITDSIDQRDPISLNKFYIINSKGEKEIIYQGNSRLILYRESTNLIRCFEKETLEYLKAYNICHHPVSLEEIPKHILDKINPKKIKMEFNSEEKALQVFQLFTDISIFIDYKLFCNLNKNELIKLNFELKDLYYQNFSKNDRIKIDKKDGNRYFKKDSSLLHYVEIEDIKIYILEQMENILKYHNKDLKFMINYIILGGLSLVIEDVKKYYDNFNFSFD